MEPWDTSILVDIITILVSVKKKPGQLQDTSVYWIIFKKSGWFPVKKMHKIMNINWRSMKENPSIVIY